MSKWAEFYSERIGQASYIRYFVDKYQKFLDQLSGSSLFEAGCGIGTCAIALHYLGIQLPITMIDLCPEMVKLAQHNTRSFNLYNTEIMVGDIRETARPCSTIYSHGVLEHLSDNDIRQAISIQRQHADKLVHYVPSNRYAVPSFGDERLMTPEQWNDICRPTNIVEFNEGKDLILIWNIDRSTNI